jgi:hypothetical protein
LRQVRELISDSLTYHIDLLVILQQILSQLLPGHGDCYVGQVRKVQHGLPLSCAEDGEGQVSGADCPL